MSAFVTKSICGGVGCAGVVGTGVYAATKYNEKAIVTVGDHLEKELKLKLISSLSKEESTLKAQWDAEFSVDKEAAKKVIGEVTDNEGGNKLREWCERQLSMDIKDFKDLSNIKRWCVVGKNIDRLPKGKSALNSQSQQSDWETIYNSAENQKQENRKKFGLPNPKDEQNKSTDIQKIKSSCDSKKDEEFLASTKETSYDLFLNWCTKS
ncbi:hypothetical protein HF1_03570 [Mycoplasma haemofelis str. Langford 1]|uniref:Uncharacterized protein n=1 Tax=Mycoplasma haemofelis (strain Langford 1) TaxID=941640 RepID=E8ZGU4_MYCHL|nr:hypothetical protein [Mycoplasma haemofelis]CBY92365.1 hypothetical protein HF1_03570 [Mycoplasma haemofelis str. Langford 1]